MSRKSRKVKVEIPWRLHLGLIKIQASEELDYSEACIHASKLLELNGNEFNKALETKVNKVKKSIILSEVNKSKKTWTEKGRKNGFNEGHKKGYQKAVSEYKITYPCMVCGEELVMKPNGKDHLAMRGFMKQAGWAHSECLNK